MVIVYFLSGHFHPGNLLSLVFWSTLRRSDLDLQLLTRLNHLFADFIEAGEIVVTPPLTQENDEPILLSKPRIAFQNNRKSAGRLNQMVLTINEMGA